MIIFSDIDGVVNDGLYQFDENGKISKRFCTRDFHVINIFANNGYEFVFLTGSSDSATVKRFDSSYFITCFDCESKELFVESYSKKRGISLADCFYIGDSVNDYNAMMKCGNIYCPSDASPVILQIEKINILKSRGGHGVIDEFLFAKFEKDYFRLMT